MTTGLKVWLWIILVLNALGAVFGILAIAVAPISAISVVLEIVLIVGIVLLLFKQKKLGFYIIIGCAVAGLLVNVILIKSNIALALISAVFSPCITYLLMKKNWNDFK